MSNKLNTSEFALKIRAENKSALDDLLNSFRHSIEHNQMPKAEEILKSLQSNNKISRPSNSDLLYTNLIKKFGLLEIVRKFCDEYKINKQDLVPISKKLSKILWDDLSDDHHEFFNKLAAEVSLEHKKIYPDYKFSPKRKTGHY